MDEISSSEYAIDPRLSRLRWKLHILKQTLADHAAWLSRLAGLFGTQKRLHTDRFATDTEVKNLASIIASATLESALWTSRSGRQID